MTRGKMSETTSLPCTTASSRQSAAYLKCHVRITRTKREGKL
jgi:hypothetical protein